LVNIDKSGANKAATLGFKNFNAAKSTLAEIEVVAMIQKGQMS
jgi:hypothetical protein